MISESRGVPSKTIVLTWRTATIAALATLLAVGCTSSEDSELSTTSVLSKTTAAETTSSDLANELATGDVKLPADFADKTISSGIPFGNMTPDSSLSHSGTVSATEVAVYTLVDAPGDGVMYQLTVTSNDVGVSLSVYDPDRAQIATGISEIVFDATIAGEYLIVISGEGDASYELTVAGTG